jgi:alkanesulfonate monooxygenase SsuD/methylene tetrahydromethanopterin reductase-like flavin-dependent oxidoreductase (luciferase family)
MLLVEQADAGYKKFLRTIKNYHFDSKNLKPRADLLAYVDAIMAVPEQHAGTFDTELYIQNLRDGQSRHEAARNAGGDPKAIKRRLKFDATLREDVELAEEEFAEQVESRLAKLALADERWAMELWLKKRYKNRWGDDPSVVQHQGEIKHSHELTAAPIIDQINEFQKTLMQRAELPEAYIDAEVIEDE